MRVRFSGPGRGARGEEVGSAFLTVGREYIVLALEARANQDVQHDYWGDGDEAAVAAQEIFERELEVILEQS